MFVNNILYSLVFVSFLLLLVDGNERDFNCPDECGLYGEKDRNGPRLHEGCSVMGHSESITPRENIPCVNNFAMEKVKKRKKKRCGRHHLIAFGTQTKYAMPWMVIFF